jgi:hypothetical protein
MEGLSAFWLRWWFCHSEGGTVRWWLCVCGAVLLAPVVASPETVFGGVWWVGLLLAEFDV